MLRKEEFNKLLHDFARIALVGKMLVEEADEKKRQALGHLWMKEADRMIEDLEELKEK